MKERYDKNRKRLRIIPLILGIYGGILGFGLIAIGVAEIREGIGIVRLLFGLGMAGVGLLGIWDGVRDLIRPGKEPEKPGGSQFILTDIFGNRSSNVTVECMREQLKSLMENERAVLFQLQILPPLTVQELGNLNCILCMYHNAFMLSAFFDRAEGECERYYINIEQSEAEEWFEKLLAGNPDFSSWEKIEDNLSREESSCTEEGMEENCLEEEENCSEETKKKNETEETLTGSEKAAANLEEAKAWGNQLLHQSQKGAAYWHKLLVIFGESWHDEHKFFSVRDVELAVEGIHEGKYQKAVLEWGTEALNLFPGVRNDLLVIWCTNNMGRENTRFLAREGTVAQVKFWLVNYLERGLFEEMSGWADITAQIEKEMKKSEKKQGKVF